MVGNRIQVVEGSEAANTEAARKKNNSKAGKFGKWWPGDCGVTTGCCWPYERSSFFTFQTIS